MDYKDQFLKELINNIELSEQDFQCFTDLFSLKKYAISDYFIQEGKLSNFCGFVYSGIMRAYVSDNNGKEANLRFIQKYGFVTGNFAKGAASSMNIQCLEECEVYIANWNTLFDILHSNNVLSSFFNNLLATGHRNIILQLSVYLRNNATQRYQLFLQQFPNLIYQIPHYHVANFLGITPVQLSRIRQKIALRETGINKC